MKSLYLRRPTITTINSCGSQFIQLRRHHHHHRSRLARVAVWRKKKKKSLGQLNARSATAIVSHCSNTQQQSIQWDSVKCECHSLNGIELARNNFWVISIRRCVSVRMSPEVCYRRDYRLRLVIDICANIRKSKVKQFVCRRLSRELGSLALTWARRMCMRVRSSLFFLRYFMVSRIVKCETRRTNSNNQKIITDNLHTQASRENVMWQR